MIHGSSPWASSDLRRVHHSDFSPASLLFKPKVRRREEAGWMGEGRADWRARMNQEGWYPLIYTSKRWCCLANFLKLICNVFCLSVALMCTAHGSCSLPHDQWEESEVTSHIKRFWLLICRERTLWVMPFFLFFFSSWGDVVRRIINCTFGARP